MTNKWKRVLAVSVLSFGIMFTAMTPLSQGAIMRNTLYSSIVWVESKGNTNAKSKDGAVGIVQIKPVMVAEVNRICRIVGSKKRYTLTDRLSATKSAEMFWIYQDFYHPELKKDSLSVAEVEILARAWNGGPNGHKIRATKKYWHKVCKKLTAKLEQNKELAERR